MRAESLYLSYCAATGLDWRAPSVEALSGFLRRLVTEPLPQRGRQTRPPRYRSKGTANALMTAVCELLRFGAAHQWVAPEAANALSEPKFLASGRVCWVPGSFGHGG
jgi:integrase/recombinase XerD